MIQCENKCLLDKFPGCCHSCPDFETCPKHCDSSPPDCGCAAFDKESGLQAFQNAQLAALDKIAAVIRRKKEAEEQEDHLRAALFDAMEKFGIEQFDSNVLSLTRVPPSMATRLDTDKLKKKYPKIADECSKTAPRAGYVKVKLKNSPRGN